MYTLVARVAHCRRPFRFRLRYERASRLPSPGGNGITPFFALAAASARSAPSRQPLGVRQLLRGCRGIRRRRRRPPSTRTRSRLRRPQRAARARRHRAAAGGGAAGLGVFSSRLRGAAPRTSSPRQGAAQGRERGAAAGRRRRGTRQRNPPPPPPPRARGRSSTSGPRCATPRARRALSCAAWRDDPRVVLHLVAGAAALHLAATRSAMALTPAPPRPRPGGGAGCLVGDPRCRPRPSSSSPASSTRRKQLPSRA